MQVIAGSKREATRELALGVGLGIAATALYWLWNFWGRSFQVAVALVAFSFLIMLIRYPSLGGFLFGFVLLSGVPIFVPGITSAFFAVMLLILVVRKSIQSDATWRMTTFVAIFALFAVWFQVSGLWVEQHNEYNWILVYRVLLGILILQELIKSVSDYIFFIVGAACGMIITAGSAIVSAYQFYTSGAAEQVAGAVADIGKARFYGHWPDPNLMAITLVAFLGLTIALWRSRIAWPVRWLMAVASCLTIFATMISLSRGGMLGCFIVIFMMIVSERRKLLLLTLFSLLFAFVLTFLPIDLLGRIVSIGSGDASTGERGSLLVAAFKLFWEAPIFGAGMGSLQHNVLQHVKYLPHSFISHNTFADIAVDGGLVGFGLFAGCLWLAIRSLNWKNWSVDPADTSAMLNVGLRASLLATIFMILTLSMIAYVPIWAIFSIAASFAYVSNSQLLFGGTILPTQRQSAHNNRS